MEGERKGRGGGSEGGRERGDKKDWRGWRADGWGKAGEMHGGRET